MRSLAASGLWLLAGGLVGLGALYGACSVYDSSLLESGGAGGTGAGTTIPIGGSGGEVVGCQTPAECPGQDDECRTRTCEAGTCGIDATAAGTEVTQQTAGDCIVNVCDGAGNVVGEPRDSDAPVDNNTCTTDYCSSGIPHHDPVAAGSDCTGAGDAHLCSAQGVCVECLYGTDCASLVCTQAGSCASPQCGDDQQNGNETDVDCGGDDCPKCEIGDDCEVAEDCMSGECNVTCQPSCTDTIQNQDESDVDCGGAECPDCAFGQMCDSPDDCATGACSTALRCTCPPQDGVLLLSEVRPRGPAQGNDDFVELYNPGSTSVTLTSEWVIASRNAEGSPPPSNYTARFTGSGQVIGARQHFLVVGSAYSGSVAGDAELASGITDKVSVILTRDSVVMDAVCIWFGTTEPPFETATPAYTCEGDPVLNPGGSTSNDKSVERKPGGVDGNCIDTGSSVDDWQQIIPSNPQNLSSPPT